MNENHEVNAANAELASRQEVMIKWFRNLFYVHIASVAVSFIQFLPISDTWTTWVSRAITVGAIICLFQLAPVHERYRKAAIFRAAMLGCALAGVLGLASSVFVFAGSICSIISVYQEYTGHSDIVKDLDAKLSRKWHSLFNWQIIVGILSGFGSVVAVILVAMLEVETTMASTLIVGAVNVAGIVLEAVYLMYLNRMWHLVKDAI